MFSLKRKGDYQLQLTRTIDTPGRHTVELYLFIPPETQVSERTLPEQQLFFGSMAHRFGLMGQAAEDRASKTDKSYTLLSPHYEIANGSLLFRYKASMGRLRLQLQNSENPVESIGRALRLSQAFAQRIREAIPQQEKQKRYFRQLDIYFSWFAEQFFLECMSMEIYNELDPELRQNIAEFLQQEAIHRKEQDYVRDFQGTPTALWNRMGLYNRLLEYPASLRSKIVELGSVTRNLVKAGTTLIIMLMLTYVLFNVRSSAQTLSMTLLFGIALIYAIRDMLREDMINVVTRWLRRGKPRWRVRLLMPYTGEQVGHQWIWLDYRKLNQLPRNIAENAPPASQNDDEAQVICYRSLLTPDKEVLDRDEIRERITLDLEAVCEMIKVSRDRVFSLAEGEDVAGTIQVHPIERQQDYHLLLVSTRAGQPHSLARLWRLTLSSNGILEYKSKDAIWPSPDEQQKRGWRDRMVAMFKR